MLGAGVKKMSKWQIIVNKGMKSIGENVVITNNMFTFSRDFIVNNNLQEKQALFYLKNPEDPYELAFDFRDEQETGAYKLRPSINRPSCLSRIASAGKMINDNMILRTIKDLPDRVDRTFDLEKDEDSSNIFFVTLCPNFDQKVKADNLRGMNPELSGIYRCLDEYSNIIYIGSGNVKERNSEHLKSFGEEISEVQYSVISNREKAYEWESHHITKFKDKHGRRPKYNKNDGRQSNSLSLEAVNVSS